VGREIFADFALRPPPASASARRCHHSTSHCVNSLAVSVAQCCCVDSLRQHQRRHLLGQRPPCPRHYLETGRFCQLSGGMYVS
jgi:hypothetical protein